MTVGGRGGERVGDWAKSKKDSDMDNSVVIAGGRGV